MRIANINALRRRCPRPWPRSPRHNLPDLDAGHPRSRRHSFNFCHGLGLGLHERPIISRLNSFDDPMELREGMVFAVETYCPATDSTSAARIEEEVIVTTRGAQIITLFPANELPIANRY